MFRKIIPALGIALSLLLAAPTRAAEPFTVLLDWFLNPDHAPLVVALQKGFFAEEGLAVDLIEPADPNDPPKLVAAGQAEVAVSYQPQLHILVGEGLPLTRIATLVATPLNTLLALEDGPIKTIGDLKGRKIGYSVGGFEDALLGAMLKQVGLGLDDVELINVNFSLSPALLSGQVDAVIGAYRNFELNHLDLEGHKGRAFFIEEHGVPAYDELIIVAKNDTLRDAKLAAFLRAVERGTTYLINHPADSWVAFLEYRPELDDELNRRAWADTLPRFALRPAALDRSRYEAFAAFLQDQGVIRNNPALDSYAVEVAR
ncbi:ABC transporter substrate-binding protein [Limibacillus halophilus]|uniref:Putative hydroxymethylpyrimidine transport system substrate-binding protein n=1 Tax=Limibacillus halophilus TaxID=1579333 RepID=A0A839SV42_9PROT|nr:ABC transporter substrate-binding protein [Limibacillus halophilus]MBB3066342.1 putative hydroxymethylpyrimidine transport system substrate-binding protein [Limibacillus halophilus]